MFKRNSAPVIPTLEASVSTLRNIAIDLGAVELNLETSIKNAQTEIEKLTQQIEADKYKQLEAVELRTAIDKALVNSAV